MVNSKMSIHLEGCQGYLQKRPVDGSTKHETHPTILDSYEFYWKFENEV